MWRDLDTKPPSAWPLCTRYLPTANQEELSPSLLQARVSSNCREARLSEQPQPCSDGSSQHALIIPLPETGTGVPCGTLRPRPSQPGAALNSLGLSGLYLWRETPPQFGKWKPAAAYPEGELLIPGPAWGALSGDTSGRRNRSSLLQRMNHNHKNPTLPL